MAEPSISSDRPVALVTGVSRAVGIGAAVATSLAADGWDVVSAGWTGYDARMPWGADDKPVAHLEVDLEDPGGPEELFASAIAAAGPVTALVMCHCESVDSDIRSTTVESFDRHFVINARATWLLIKAFAEQFSGPDGAGRIVAFTSDDTAGNVPYGASKGALDRIVIAAATELADLGVTANVINPGGTDTGWMTPEIKASTIRRNISPRVGLPADAANLVTFLCSPAGAWINAQLLYSDGGIRH